MTHMWAGTIKYVVGLAALALALSVGSPGHSYAAAAKQTGESGGAASIDDQRVAKLQRDLFSAIWEKDRRHAATLINQLRGHLNFLNPDLKATDSATPMTAAAIAGDTAILEALLDAGAGVDDTIHLPPSYQAKYAWGKTALMSTVYAPRDKQREVVQLLLDRGANPNAKSDGGESALTYALFTGQAIVVRALLEGGSTIDIRNCTYEAVSGIAHEDWNALSLVVLRLNGDDDELAIAELVIKLGATQEDKDHALKRALKMGRDDVVSFLLAHGADPRLVSATGATANHGNGSYETYHVAVSRRISTVVSTDPADSPQTEPARVRPHLDSMLPNVSLSFLGFGGLSAKSFHTTAIEFDTKQPISGSFVLARESTWVYTPGIVDGHSDSFCFRSDVAAAESSSDATIVLPTISGEDTSHINKGGTYVGFVGYKPGYCAASPAPGGVSGAFLKDMAERSPGFSAPPPAQAAGETISIYLKRSRDTGEIRLQYLLRLARDVGRDCRIDNWGEGGLNRRKEMAAAIMNEADGIAQSPVERVIAQRIHKAFDPSVHVDKIIPTVFLSDPDDVVRISEDFGVEIAASESGWDKVIRMSWDGWQVGALFVPAGSEYGVYCRGGPLSMCNFNERDNNGRTHLMRALWTMDVDEAATFLALGVDPNVAVTPGGPTALDTILGGIEGIESHTDSDRRTKLLKILDLLINSKKATVDPTLLDRILGKASLGSNPVFCSPQWAKSRQAEQFCADFTRQVVPKLRGLPLNKPVQADCS
jgi:ankyrin repeat protein